MFEQYTGALVAAFVMLITAFAQSLIAMIAHRRQSHYIPGVLDETLGHESFVFRSHRTFQNSLENLPLMFGTLILAIFSGFNPATLALFSWVYAIARIIHMALYYKIATEKNPSPRSYFFTLALLANLVLLVMVGAHLLSL